MLFLLSGQIHIYKNFQRKGEKHYGNFEQIFRHHEGKYQCPS